MKVLVAFTMQENSLTGGIPIEMGHMERLQTLWLHDQKGARDLSSRRLLPGGLTGNILFELGRIFKLVRVSFGNNNLDGPIPSELSNNR